MCANCSGSALWLGKCGAPKKVLSCVGQENCLDTAVALTHSVPVVTPMWGLQYDQQGYRTFKIESMGKTYVWKFLACRPWQ